MSNLLHDVVLRLQNGDIFGAHSVLITILIGTVLATAVSIYSTDRPYKKIPVLGAKASTTWKAKKEWLSSAPELMRNGLLKSKRPFQLMGNVGPLIILPPAVMNEIKTDDRMTFSAWLREHFFTEYPGFDGFSPAASSEVFVHSVKMGLAQNLSRITETLDGEVKSTLNDLFPYSEEWKEVNMDEDALKIIARLSTAIFTPELAHNEEWLKLAVDYAVHFFTGAFVLRMIPSFLRPLIHWFLPFTRQLRKDVAAARRLIDPILEKRKRERAEAEQAGIAPPEYNDAIEWVDATVEKKGISCDPVAVQLNYTLGAVHTTTITFVNSLYDVMANPQYKELLLEEILAVEKEDPGWTKPSLAKLKLMDSVMKESTRLTPSTFIPVNRVAEVDVTLSDGTFIPKGATLGLPTFASNDPAIYPNPAKFDGHRFYNLSNESANAAAAAKYAFVGTSNDHVIFGHGKHACPGRFFANNEIKLLLIHLLQDYEFKFVDGKRPQPSFVGADQVLSPDTKILMRSKKV